MLVFDLCHERTIGTMYSHLLVFHSLFRWLVLASLLLSLYRSVVGYSQHKSFTSTDNLFRHWTATIAHIQLIVGILLYIKSPLIQYFWSNFGEGLGNANTTFFSVVHFGLMLISVVFVTLGSALAKRKPTDREKFRTMLIWFSASLLIIGLAIPWPFSPFAQRPYFRTF